MNTLKNAFLVFCIFISVCAVIYCGVLVFFSVISGWRVLSLNFPAPETVQSESAVFNGQTVKMGFMEYSMSVSIRFTGSGLIFSQSPFFSFMHKPFFIPYDKIVNSQKKDLSGSVFEFTIEGVAIRMSERSAEALKRKKLNPALSVVLLNPDKYEDGSSVKKGEPERVTKQCLLKDLQPLFIKQINDFLKSRGEGEISDVMSVCFESTYREKGFFGIVYHQYTDLVITHEWFFWAVIDGDGSSAGSVKISDIAEMPNFDKELVLPKLKVSGIDISGFTYDESGKNTWTLTIAEDAAGTAFRKALLKMARNYSEDF